MPVRKLRADLLPSRRVKNHSVYEEMAEWKEVREILYQGVLIGEALEIELSAASRKKSGAKKPEAQFSQRFRKRVSPKDYRYEMFCRDGKIYVLGKSQQTDK